jgi:hypothetical protein
MSWDERIKATASDLAGKARQLGKSIPRRKSIRAGVGHRRKMTAA